MPPIEKALVIQNAKLIMARIGDQVPHSGMLLRDAPGDSANPDRARYYVLLASHLIDQYVRSVPGRENETYDLSSPSLLGTIDPADDEFHWRIQDDLETYTNAWRDKSLQQSVLDKAVAFSPGYSLAFCFFALRFATLIRRIDSL